MVLVRQADYYDLDDGHLSSAHVLGFPFLPHVQSESPRSSRKGWGTVQGGCDQQENKLRKAAHISISSFTLG